MENREYWQGVSSKSLAQRKWGRAEGWEKRKRKERGRLRLGYRMDGRPYCHVSIPQFLPGDAPGIVLLEMPASKMFQFFFPKFYAVRIRETFYNELPSRGVQSQTRWHKLRHGNPRGDTNKEVVVGAKCTETNISQGSVATHLRVRWDL